MKIVDCLSVTFQNSLVINCQLCEIKINTFESLLSDMKHNKKDHWLIRFPCDCVKHLFLFRSSCQYFLSPSFKS